MRFSAPVLSGYAEYPVLVTFIGDPSVEAFLEYVERLGV